MQAGDVLGNRYHLIDLVGKGRSEVFLARDGNTSRLLAVKVIKKTSKNIDSFMREKALLAVFEHPGIPSIVDQIDTDSECCVIMNYYNGETLYNRIKRESDSATNGEIVDMSRRESEVIEWMKGLCSILTHIHTHYKKERSTLKAPVIHRDIKPENIMIEDSGIKLIDWGIAGEFKRGVPDMGPNWGTPNYAAPEQCPVGAKYIDERTDIFSLGATMFYALTSVVPPKDKKNIPPIASINPNISEGMGIIIDKCLKYNPEERYQSAEELLDDLNHIDFLTKKTRSEKKRSLILFGLCIFFCIVGSVLSIVSNSIINSNNSDNYMSKIQLADAAYDDAMSYRRKNETQKSEEAFAAAADYYKQAITYNNRNIETYERLFNCYLLRNTSNDESALMDAIDSMRRQYVDEKNSGAYHSNRMMYLIAKKCMTLSDNPLYLGYAVDYLELIKDSPAYRNNTFTDGFSKIEVDSMCVLAKSLYATVNETNASELVEALTDLETETDSSVNDINDKLVNYLDLLHIYSRYYKEIEKCGTDPYEAILRIVTKSKEIIDKSEDLSFNNVSEMYQIAADSFYMAATSDSIEEIKRRHCELAIEWYKNTEEEFFISSELPAMLILKHGNSHRLLYESYNNQNGSNSMPDGATCLETAKEKYRRVLDSDDSSDDIINTKFIAQMGITYCCAYNKLYHSGNSGELRTEYDKTVRMMDENRESITRTQQRQYSTLVSYVEMVGV